MDFSYLQFSDEYAKVVEALEEETNRLRAELNRLEDEKIEILKVNIGLKKTVCFMYRKKEKINIYIHICNFTSKGYYFTGIIHRDNSRTRSSKESDTEVNVRRERKCITGNKRQL